MRTAGHHAEGELDGPAAADRTERVDHEVAVDQREEHLWRWKEPVEGQGEAVEGQGEAVEGQGEPVEGQGEAVGTHSGRSGGRAVGGQ